MSASIGQISNFKPMKKLSLSLALIAVSTLIVAQTKFHILKGQVNDPHGNPVAQAIITNASDSNEKSMSDAQGIFALESKNPIRSIKVKRAGMKSKTIAVTNTFVTVELSYINHTRLVETTVAADIAVHDDMEPEMSVMESISTGSRHRKMAPHMGRVHTLQAPPNQNTESYNGVEENDFHYATEDPLSTFSIDVDRASYSNIRRFINNGQLPPVDAVRVEEMINYFDYEYESPKGKDPVKIYTELGQAPWNSDHQLLQIGIKAKDLELESLPPSNIVFLIDVSGSMNQPNKLPLLKSSMKILVQQMRDKDRVAIVVYAGAAGLVLESTPGDDKQKIYNAIDNPSAGGSTAGGAGIKLAYQVALENFVEDGNNRIVLATDGDFNVGAASDSDMEALIKTKRDQGVFLTVLGFGMGNYKDSKMEILADKGNGNYAYIDNITEAKKTLVNEFGGTMFAVAKDVKIQVEFNPANVAEYRLIGYDNRMLNKEDFNNDKKDAGEMGVGHVVTALYEIVPIGKSSNRVDPLKYQKSEPITEAVLTDEVVTVKLRYKEPDGEKSRLMSHIVKAKVGSIDRATNNLKWSASVAGFGMLLHGSDHVGSYNYDAMIKLAETAVGEDKEGYRRECLQLMKSAELLNRTGTAQR